MAPVFGSYLILGNVAARGFDGWKRSWRITMTLDPFNTFPAFPSPQRELVIFITAGNLYYICYLIRNDHGEGINRSIRMDDAYVMHTEVAYLARGRNKKRDTKPSYLTKTQVCGKQLLFFQTFNNGFNNFKLCLCIVIIVRKDIVRFLDS